MKDEATLPTCPFCGVGMIEKPKVLERKKFECPLCKHSELMYNRVETAILRGQKDDEITHAMAKEIFCKEYVLEIENEDDFN